MLWYAQREGKLNACDPTRIVSAVPSRGFTASDESHHRLGLQRTLGRRKRPIKIIFMIVAGLADSFKFNFPSGQICLHWFGFSFCYSSSVTLLLFHRGGYNMEVPKVALAVVQ